MNNLSLDNQIKLCSGKDEWYTKDFSKDGILSVMMSDGPHGLRKQEGGGDMLGVGASNPATCFPTASIAACSFDEKLMEEYGRALGLEAIAENISMVLGPGVCIKRNPLCGRNFEYLSEDPYLSGKLAAAYINGMQKTGVAACIKHFACNSQEYFRMTSDSLIDERTLREIYLSAFEIAVKESSPRAIMGAYNKINGSYCCSSRKLLTDVLRGEWGFDGIVVTDWTAVHNRSDSFRAGCDLVMPGGNGFGEKEVIEDINKGLLDENQITACADRMIDFVGWCKREKDNQQVDFEAHHKLSEKIACESAVLLRNEDSILPLNDFNQVAFIGYMAEEFRYQGFGSSKINPARLDEVVKLMPDIPYEPGVDANGDTSQELLEKAKELAARSEKVVAFVGLPGIYESEGYDRPDMKLPEGHNKLIETISEVNENVIVVLLGGSCVELPWLKKVKAVLYMGLSGQAGAGAALKLISGEKSPSGKLAETWPVCYEDVVTSDFYLDESRDAQYREGLYVGYRYYDKADVTVRFPFGYGLSYTRYKYENIAYDSSNNRISVDVTNIGSRAGKEAILLYVRNHFDASYRPVRELKRFTKIHLEVNETKHIEFELDDRAFAYWDKGWVVDEGQYTIEICGNDARLEASLEVSRNSSIIKGENLWDTEDIVPSDWYIKLQGKPTEDDFRTIFKGKIEKNNLKPYNINSNIADMLEDSWILRRVYAIYERQLAKEFGRGSAGYKGMMIMARECPLRSVQNNLIIKNHFAQAIADLGNKKYLKMIKHLLS